MEEFVPRFRLGMVLPAQGKVFHWAPYEFYLVVPRGVMLISTSLSPSLSEYTTEAVTSSLASWWDCVAQLMSHRADWVELAGVPVSALLGRERVLDLIDQTQKRHKVSTSSRLESVIAAMQHLGARTVTIGSRWQAELNEAVAKYLAAVGIQVVGQTTRGQRAAQARAMSEVEGMDLALELGREAMALAPQADAVFLPGGAWVTTHAIVPLENEFDKPILTNFNATVWNALRRTGVVPPIRGWGKLLAS